MANADMELFVIRKPADTEKVTSDALNLLEDAACENCDVAVGFDLGRFFPCVACVSFDSDDIWFVCEECAAGVITPGE